MIHLFEVWGITREFGPAGGAIQRFHLPVNQFVRYDLLGNQHTAGVTLMRFILGFLSGAIGALAGWAGLAVLVISLAGPDRDGGIAMGAFFQIGPLGGLVGFVAGVIAFIKIGMVPVRSPSPSTDARDAAPVPPRSRISRAFALAVLFITGGLAWLGWYELIRSPYHTHGYMTLELQFRLPAGMALPPDATDLRIAVMESQRDAGVQLGQLWHGTDGNRRVILASATLSRKTSQREVTLALPGVSTLSWPLDLPSDPDPTPGYSPWRLPSRSAGPRIEMNFHLGATR